ncbi:MAG: hypothetical protein ACD_15C00165G0011 [uncultured bacterium]|nr:MAG: hypothetical protein ACD_15C00165G0011 [uncultured bacterium]
MDQDKIRKMQEIRDEYTRRMDALRQQQADIVREFIMQRERKQQEQLMTKLNA